MSRLPSRMARFALLVCTYLMMTGCSTIYSTTAWFAYDFSEEYGMPYMMKDPDIQLGCGMSEAMTPALLGFSEVTWAPDRLAVMLYMQTGACMEERAAEEGLQYLRAFHVQNAAEAKDARIRQKRLYAVAAQRQHRAYKHLVAEFGAPGEECPSMSDDEEIFWLMGLTAGMQAVMNDVSAQGQAGVPKDIIMKSIRGAKCLDAKKWWGVPSAMQAALWAMMPENAPNGVNPWQELKKSSEMGMRAGVRLASAIEVVVANNLGETERLRDAIRRHAASLKNDKQKKQYRQLDNNATQQILMISDYMWTEATGSRTPIGGLGTFWDDKEEEEALDINDFLD